MGMMAGRLLARGVNPDIVEGMSFHRLSQYNDLYIEIAKAEKRAAGKRGI